MGGLSDADQARAFIGALSGQPVAGNLQEALRSGELLCDMANVLLTSEGCMPCVVTRSADSASSGQAAASRLRAKQLENISRYMSACIDLGVDRKNHRDIAEDVADA